MAALMYAYEDIFCAKEKAAELSPPVQPVEAAAASTPKRSRVWVGLMLLLVALTAIAAAVLLLVRVHAAFVVRRSLIPPPEPAVVRPSAPIQAAIVPVTSNACWSLLNDDQRLVVEFSDRNFDRYFDQRTFDGWSENDRAGLERRLIDALRGPHSDEYYQAINSLAALHSTNSLPLIRKVAFEHGDRILRSEVNNRARWMAVRALGIIGDETAVPRLVHLLYHNNSNTRWWAQVSLVRLTGRNFGKDWQAWGRWWNSQNGLPPFRP
jgi:hypothetical protein